MNNNKNKTVFSEVEIKVFSAFAQEFLEFHPAYKIQLTTLYNMYVTDLKQKNLDQFIVGLRKFFRLIKTVVDSDFLSKKYSKKEVFFLGVTSKQTILTDHALREKYPNYDPCFFDKTKGREI